MANLEKNGKGTWFSSSVNKFEKELRKGNHNFLENWTRSLTVGNSGILLEKVKANWGKNSCFSQFRPGEIKYYLKQETNTSIFWKKNPGKILQKLQLLIIQKCYY